MNYLSKTNLQFLSWDRALNLSERASLLHNTKDKTSNLPIDLELAQKRIQNWKDLTPFQNNSNWTQRLLLDNLSEQDFLNLLGESTKVNKPLTFSPQWLIEIEQAFSEANTDRLFASEPKDIGGFLYLVEPTIARGYKQLEEAIQSLAETHESLPFDPKSIITKLFRGLSDKLLEMLNRTLLLELNVARLQGILSGDTPEARFDSFINYLRQQERAWELLQEYPVLARQIQICIDRWVEFSLEFLQHLSDDWHDICNRFSPQTDPGLLVELQGDAGDSHRGGRSVLIAKFSSGLQIVYKPRSLTIDIHFQELLIWLNSRGHHPPFKTIEILDCGSHGWVEFVSFAECKTKSQIKRFYQRQGGYLALLYALGATDFHCENLIAAGEHPVLIDLESLFHPNFQQKSDRVGQLVHEFMNNSILTVGLLPQRRWMNDDSEGIDLSGLGSTKGQLTPYGVPYWEGKGTDCMHLKRQRIEIPQEKNQPTLTGKPVSVLDYEDALISGFNDVYQLLVKYRDELFKDNSPLACFAKDKVRVIVRDTYVYGSLLAESFHPDVLRNALDRDRLFDRLWLGSEEQPYLMEIIAAEREDLWQGDVPFFATSPDSRDIWSSSGKRIKNFLAESGNTVVKRRFQTMGEEDLSRQLWLIRASLATLSTDEISYHSPTRSKLTFANVTNEDRLLQAACQIGDRLSTLAFGDERATSWVGLNLINDKHWVVAPVGMDVYSGLPGIILFLAYLGHLTQQERYTNLAKAALTTLQHQITTQQTIVTSIGAFEGWGGIIYTLTQLGMLWGDRKLIAQAESLVQLLLPLVAEDEQFDLVAGAAGCIASLLSLYRCCPSRDILTVALQCGDRLLATAQPMKQGIGWLGKNLGTQPLAGFSHGVAGIAWALLKLAAISGEQRFQQAALEAISYERSLFQPQAANWLDLRQFTASVLGEPNSNHQFSCQTAWCHGAPGIGLARLLSLPYLDNPDLRDEIDLALKTTCDRGFGDNHSLCHGDLGNLELLLQASSILESPYWQQKVERLSSMILESIDRHGWLCGVPLNVETPGLMTGLAGIGYGLLRLAAPNIIPSVLVLETPKI